MEWISVKDRLPEETGRYLVDIHQEDDEHGESGDFVVEAWWRDVNLPFVSKSIGWTLLNEFYDLTEQLKGYITHWMPFPEPPKEADNT